MYICDKCGDTTPDLFIDENSLDCPCGGERVEATTCEIDLCDNYIPKWGEGVCEECLKYLADLDNAIEYGAENADGGFNDFLIHAIPETRLYDIILRELRESGEAEKAAKKYCLEDCDTFALWCIAEHKTPYVTGKE